MSDTTQIRINELARELEVKARAILEVLPQLGVTEKKTHSSSVEVDVAEKVRQHFLGLGVEAVPEAEAAPAEAESEAAPPTATAEHAAPPPSAHVEHLPAAPSAAHPPARPVPPTPAPAVYPRIVPQPAASGV